jgi:hypothetical protein
MVDPSPASRDVLHRKAVKGPRFARTIARLMTTACIFERNRHHRRHRRPAFRCWLSEMIGSLPHESAAYPGKRMSLSVRSVDHRGQFQFDWAFLARGISTTNRRRAIAPSLWSTLVRPRGTDHSSLPRSSYVPAVRKLDLLQATGGPMRYRSSNVRQRAKCVRCRSIHLHARDQFCGLRPDT